MAVRWLLIGLLLATPARSGAVDGGVPLRKPARTLRDVKLLYFWASWCASCRAFEAAQVLDRVKASIPALVVEKIDVDMNEALLERYGVTHTPSLVLVDADGFPLGKPAVELSDAEGTRARLERLVHKMAKPGDAGVE